MKDLSASEKSHISRRTFINNAFAGTAVIFLHPAGDLFISPVTQAVNTWPDDAFKFRFHMIGQAHIDPVWLWPWPEGVAVVHSTFRSALDWMKRNPGFCFTASSAQFYEWIAANDPEMLEEIRVRVNEGRWSIAGGWWIEPDVNIPCGESMVRQGVYGQMTFRKLIGKQASFAFNPDSFGHAGSLPQIFRLQGMENYVFMRPQPKEKMLPADIFWWEGIDGTRILTYRIPVSYNDNGPVRNRIRQVLQQYKNEPVNSFMAFYGAGDHGGGATHENIESIEELKNEKGAPAIFFSTPERYFKEIRESSTATIPVVKDDLQFHAVGCYTAESEIKKGNRHSEATLITAEKLSSVGSFAWKSFYPKNALNEAWKRLLFLQFHDSLAGTSLREHSQTASEGFGHVKDIAEETKFMALQKLEWQIPAEDPASQYLIVFNPHAWEVKTNIEYDLTWAASRPSAAEDENGNHLPFQWSAASSEAGNRRKILVNTPIPPFGYRQIRIKEGEAKAPEKIVRAEGNMLENDFLRLTVSKSGTIGILDKETGKELFAGGESGCRAIVINDTSDTWSHDIRTFSDETGEFGNAAIKITENGPLRATIRITSKWGDSTLVTDWSLIAGAPYAEAKITLDWHEHLKMLKFSFPVNAENPVAATEIPYGFIERKTDGTEVPGQRWIDVTGKQGAAISGLTVFNDAKYGYSIHGNDLRISIVRSPVYAHHTPRVLDMNSEHLWMDQGIKSFRMMLFPHKGKWQENNITRIAEEFMSPPAVIYQGIHGGVMPKSGSFLKVDKPGVIIPSIKLSENENDLVFRAVETLGTKTDALIDFTFAGLRWKCTFRPCEIKTLRINIKSGNIKEVNLLEE